MKPLPFLLVVAALISLLACGGSSKATVSITLTPTTASVATTQNAQFAAAVTGGSTTAVTWEVNGVPFGDINTVGSITSAGLYTAPAAVPNPASVTITAIPVADTTKSATATVTVTLGANLAINPSSLTMAAGAQQAFTVTSNGSAATGIVYTLSCHSSAPGACGLVTTAGIYTAPLSPPPQGNVILTASLTQGGSTFSTSATITIQSSAQTLSGQYAFDLSGTSGGATFRSAGTITFDGNGNVTGGAETVNSNGAVTQVAINGCSACVTFSPAQGRAQVNLSNATWYIALANRSHGFIEAGGAASASGTIDLQDSTQFTTAAVNGSYSFRVSGLNTNSPAKQVAIVGAFSADGAGTLSSGLLDANDGGSLSSGQPVTGSLAAPSATTGAGTLTLNSGFGTQTFAYFIVDGTRIKLVETDANRSTAGDAVKQSNGPYATGDFHGNLYFILNGMSGTAVRGVGGTLAISSGAVTGGSVDENVAGLTPSLGEAVTAGNYAVQDANTGRTTGTITAGGKSIPVVWYPVSDTSFNLLEADTTQVSSGVAAIGTGGNGTNSSLAANYALNLTGVAGSTPEDIVGQLIANGGGVFTGTVDITNGGAGTALLASPYQVSTVSTATLKSGFANFGSVGFNLYIVDSNQVFLLENDNKGVLTGVMQIQN